MIRVEVAKREFVPSRGWCVKHDGHRLRLFDIRQAGWDVFEDYVDPQHNVLYVLCDDEAAAALFKLTFL